MTFESCDSWTTILGVKPQVGTLLISGVFSLQLFRFSLASLLSYSGNNNDARQEQGLNQGLIYLMVALI